MIDKVELQRLRDLPIEGVAERLGLHVSHHKSLCPFHTTDRHPSMSYHVGKNICRCFVCMDEAIGPVDLVMRCLNKNFREACEWLADGNGLSLTLPSREATESRQKPVAKPFDASRYARFFEHPWLSEAARRFLFEERQLDPRVVSWCRLTSWQDRNGVTWLQIPYYDMEGRLIGVQNRNLDYQKDHKGSEGAGRFKFPYGSQTSCYNLQIVKFLKPGDECWIAEGCSDCWSLMSDHKKALAIASATLLQPKDKQLLQEITAQLSIRWRMAPDNDEPGRQLAAQLKKVLPMLEIVELPEGCKDYSDAFVKTKKEQSDAKGSCYTGLHKEGTGSEIFPDQ